MSSAARRATRAPARRATARRRRHPNPAASAQERRRRRPRAAARPDADAVPRHRARLAGAGPLALGHFIPNRTSMDDEANALSVVASPPKEGRRPAANAAREWNFGGPCGHAAAASSGGGRGPGAPTAANRLESFVRRRCRTGPDRPRWKSRGPAAGAGNDARTATQAARADEALRILDAPDIVDDYYLNLLSWSSMSWQALQRYLWNATSEVSNGPVRAGRLRHVRELGAGRVPPVRGHGQRGGPLDGKHGAGRSCGATRRASGAWRGIRAFCGVPLAFFVCFLRGDGVDVTSTGRRRPGGAAARDYATTRAYAIDATSTHLRGAPRCVAQRF